MIDRDTVIFYIVDEFEKGILVNMVFNVADYVG